MIRVIFINFELGFDNNLQTLVGASNKFYGGPSRWNVQYQSQAIETEFASARDFVAAMKDIAGTYSLYARKWVPIPQIKEAPTVAELFDIKNLSDAEIEAEIHRRSPAYVRRDSGGEDNQIIAVPDGPEPVTAATPFFALKSLAKKNGIDLEGCKDNAERAERINKAMAVPA